MIEFDMTHMVPEPALKIAFVGDLPEEHAEDFGLFLVVSRFEFVDDHAITYLVAPRGRRAIEAKLRSLHTVIGDDLVVVDLYETIADEAAGAARIEALRSARLNTLVLGAV